MLTLALAEQRVLFTEDKDFDQLLLSGLARSPGVIIMRFGHAARSSLLATLRDLVELHVDRIEGTFVVVEPGRIRISPRRPAAPRE